MDANQPIRDAIEGISQLPDGVGILPLEGKLQAVLGRCAFTVLVMDVSQRAGLLYEPPMRLRDIDDLRNYGNFPPNDPLSNSRWDTLSQPQQFGSLDEMLDFARKNVSLK